MSAREGLEAVVVAWFLSEYEAKHLLTHLNAGTTPTPFEPHVGHREQASANAKRILDAVLRYQHLLEALVEAGRVEECPSARNANHDVMHYVERHTDA